VAKRKKQKQRVEVAESPATGALGAGLAALGFRASAAPAEAAPSGSSPSAPVLAGKQVVRRERKGRGGRTVTVITGVGGDLEAFAKAARKALGCGATVEGDAVVLQGDLTSRARDYLVGLGAKRVVLGN